MRYRLNNFTTLLCTIFLVCSFSSCFEVERNNPEDEKGDNYKDTIAPTVSSTYPTDGATAVPINTNITANFNEDIDNSTINDTSFTISNGVTGTVTYDGGTKIATFTPSSNLAYNTAYSVTITTDVTDLAGNRLETDYVWSFTTGDEEDTTSPLVENVNPTDGSTIDVDAVIVIQFNESMSPFSLELSGDMKDECGTREWTQTVYENDTLTINPTSAWAAGDNRTLTIDCNDVAGNLLEQITLTYNVVTVPEIISVNPPTGSVIGAEIEIIIQFSESMNTSSLELTGDMASESDGGVWSQTIVTNDTLTITPSIQWGAGTSRSIIIDCNDSEGDSLGTLELSYSIDSDKPSGTVQPPADGSAIGVSTAIEIIFTKSMDTTTLSLGGNMASESDGGAWSISISDDDTLTISPSASWTDGDGRTLTITCSDLAGNSIDGGPIVLTFGVLDGIVYVKTDGTDDNPGTPISPKKSIHLAVELAETLFSTADVYVAQGTYDVSVPDQTHVRLSVDGISLYGGYSSSNWGDRDPSTYTTTIQEISDTGSWHYSIYAVNVTNATVIDGFSINGGINAVASQYSYAISINGAYPTVTNNIINGGSGQYSHGIGVQNSASPLIENNQINGGSGTDNSYGIKSENSSPTINSNPVINGGNGNYSYGIYNYQSSSIISNNQIDGGTGASWSVGINNHVTISGLSITNNTVGGGDHGIYNDNSSGLIARNHVDGGEWSGIQCTGDCSSLMIINNTIDGGDGGSDNISTGVRTYTSSPIIRNNTIDGGSGTTNSYGIHINAGSLPIIDNNIIFTTAASNDYGIFEQSDGSQDSNPSSLQNNDIFDCTTLYHDRQGGATTDFTNIGDVNNWINTTQSTDRPSTGNVPDDPGFVNQGGGDWHLQASSPVNVRQGGLDGVAEVWGFTTDKDDETKTNLIDGPDGSPTNDNAAGWSMGAYECDD
ncbi:MAG: Ig-like domain-containing protein [Spirochaetota bacterium]|nr:Ig-like domain-containing protein [Spirochaetota bacterium]